MKRIVFSSIALVFHQHLPDNVVELYEIGSTGILFMSLELMTSMSSMFLGFSPSMLL